MSKYLALIDALESRSRTDELGQLPHDEDCPAEWARRQLANGITAKAEGGA